MGPKAVISQSEVNNSTTAPLLPKANHSGFGVVFNYLIKGMNLYDEYNKRSFCIKKKNHFHNEFS